MATADNATAQTTSAALASRPSRWRGAAREILLVLAGVLVYFGVRGVTVTDAQEALDHALDLVAIERATGLYVEPSLQTLVLGSDWLVDVMNWVYVWGHWPVIVASCSGCSSPTPRATGAPATRCSSRAASGS